MTTDCYSEGQDTAYRFSLASELTFLAWNRWAVVISAAAVVLHPAKQMRELELSATT